MKRRKWVQAIFLTATVLLCAVQTNAALITIQFSGHVTSASGSALPDTIYEGKTFTGTYTYDSETPNTSGSSFAGRYVHNSPYGITIVMGEVEFKTVSVHSGQFEIGILDAIVNYDRYNVISKANNSVNGTPIDSIGWMLGGPPSTISSFALPVSEPAVIAELGNWENNVLEISGSNLLIRGTVEEVTLVPEPSITPLIVLGALFFRRKR